MSADWPISGISTPSREGLRQTERDALHSSAMGAAGWYNPTGLDVDQKVLVSLSNGYETWGVVVRFYKNGAVRVRPLEGGRSNNRSPNDLWLKKVNATLG